MSIEIKMVPVETKTVVEKERVVITLTRGDASRLRTALRYWTGAYKSTPGRVNAIKIAGGEETLGDAMKRLNRMFHDAELHNDLSE